MQQFNFDTQAISCQSPLITLAPGDKVLYEVGGRRGSRHRIKGIVEAITSKRVRIQLRFKGRQTGAIRTETKTVERWYLHRYNWSD